MEKPIITGIEDVSVAFGTSFDPLDGVESLSSSGEDLTGNISLVNLVNPTKSGEYQVIYAVSDHEGNLTVETREVKVLPPDSVNPAVELQKAIVQKLSKGSWNVYEVLPPKTPFPFIQIGETTRLRDDSKTGKRHSYTVRIHSFSEGTSSLESKQINEFILNSMMDGLKVEGFNTSRVTLDLETTLREQEVSSTVFHGVLDFNIILQEI